VLDAGYDIRTIQGLLGHKDVTTTMIYTHVLNRGGHGVHSPVDQPWSGFIQPAKIPSAAQDLAAKGIDRKMLRRYAAMRGKVLFRQPPSVIVVLDRLHIHCSA
jgi:hypothetical protein